MRSHWCVAAPSLLLATIYSSNVHGASASPAASTHDLRSYLPTAESPYFLKRDGHGHHSHSSAPLLELNETEVIINHAPTPPSYYTIDWDGHLSNDTRHPGLIISHAIFMSLAFFVALPLGIAMRSVNHPWHGVTVVAFYAFSALGCATSGLYTKLTPNMYAGSLHGKHGYFLLFLALLLSAVDIISAMRRIILFFNSGEPKSLRRFWRSVVLKREGEEQGNPEYTGLIVKDPEEFDEAKLDRHSDLSRDHDEEMSNTVQWANNVHHHRRQFSTTSEGTVFDLQSPSHSDDTFHDQTLRRNQSSKSSLVRRIGDGLFIVLERFLVIAAFSLLLTGIVVYTGGCRENYINGCLAHLIKGGIFWCYGLLTFARFLGSFAELGWAWNRAPSSDSYSAEFVESLVIFIYGATNTWMERFGAKPGDPFTTKQIQHISIAVMFCFAGLVGMGIESKRVRKWLASSTFASLSSPSEIPQDAVAEPPSYWASFNPFPALVMGVTGAAMAAHAQTYLFQVQIHSLWGNLLVAFSVLRCMTYFFLWLGPPQSILPSRPPTEALGSFFLACGGLVFMFSTEEVTIAAMRRGRDDVMMFLNVAVAITCFAFCWTLCVVGFKGWLKSRIHGVTFRTSA
ncbi:hypothetical protein BDQ12DRAFT_674879 [Crucibulum laeve]|uniref:Cytoplasmic protein n=1 Tax=Crucibulum laeve TaxID=68775 RepID=A0A5C3MQ92_9AGAR|nr:hypothetical protein BDQ12DRAFT_674879 [Crucibulum laeve]